MFPLLYTLHLGGHDVGIHTYGVVIGVGIAAGIAMAYRQARRQPRFDPGRVLDLSFWMVVAGLVGSRIVYGLVNARDFARACVSGDGSARALGAVVSDCTRILQVWQGGLVFYGGVAGAALVLYLFAKRERWRFAELGDLFAPGLAFGHAIGRLGCFAAGCCFGKESAAAWAVSFPRGSVAFDDFATTGGLSPGADLTPPLHPTQLYEAAGELAIFALLLLLRRRKPRAGTLLASYVVGYAVVRFVVEMFRGDAARRFVVALATPRFAAWLHLPVAEPVFVSVSQLGSVIALAFAAAVALRRRAPRTPAP